MKTENDTLAVSDDVVTRPISETHVSYELLHRSATNPRRRFLPGPLKELAANIIKWGVQTRLHVRPSKEVDGAYEIIAGERRHRALELAMQEVEGSDVAGKFDLLSRLMQVPVKVTDWTDDEVIDFQLIENVQREDLTPLEEADSFAQMVKRGKSVEEIAGCINREANYIYRALKWARLPALAREAFERGILKKELATMIARIPDEKMRLRATLEMVFFPNELIEDEKDIAESEASAWAYLKDEPEALSPMSVKDARDQAARFYMKSLKGAAFDLDDQDLMPVELDADGCRVRGGDCASCPFRTGNNVLFSGDLAGMKSGHGRESGVDENTCTQPSCYTQKLVKLWDRTKAEAEAKGMKVLDAAAADKIFQHGGRVRYGSDFVDLDEKPSLDLVNLNEAAKEDAEATEKKLPTWKKLLKNVEIEKYVVLDRDQVPHVLVKREVAVLAVNEKAKATGKESLFADAAKSADRPGMDSYKKELKKQAEEKKRNQLAFVLCLKKLSDQVLTNGVDVDGWWILVDLVLHDLDMDGIRLLASAFNVKPEAPAKSEGNLNAGHYAAAILEDLKSVTRSPLELQAVVIMCLSARSAWRLLDGEILRQTCGHWGVSLTEAKNQAKDDLKQKATKKEKKAEEEAASVADTTEYVNAEISTQTILEEGDKQREQMPSRAMNDDADTEEQSTPAAEMTFEEQVGALIVGSHKMTDLIGKTPPKGSPERKPWDARLVKLLKAVKKAE